ncbi:type I-F CRISPR-associated helicase Cas3 [Mergibacter septicus]|uniref:Type I-F CRISPR-associated helicase Cas3 n=1 Tax=Mergibacter septicus TaxID=221402 RepID=A0A8D4IWQ1_9PAST|nr:type I-F CRISPR-associated helicase Cas3f [Mergibacter septicus]AWX14799.1 type I-F CRISPR-associated helicase Cas3 [Mergibacter septicus]QDJ14050.1 type I-F CRISPR-associated helicase Cas3 [Mergibacter septicus]UTU48502.1 type I-F CRISPR-associated helicase Cas3 [Mergibacter septicus]WMR95870.1 type I-F CRISPR-associated helicase Cas3f [Mergibacter septicus]
MNILLISECSKQALVETRRVLDQFAERKGQRTWQTPITFEGLKTLRMLLKKTARKNTAVACYWIRAKNQTELLWIVGNRRKFNLEGSVPTNMTQRDILRSQDENNFNSIHTSAILAGLAGLFHDFGKANQLFQNKLTPKTKTSNFEPYRHEWLSLLLFAEFIKDQEKSSSEQVVYLDDQTWLTRLANISDKSPDLIEKQLTEKKTFDFTQLPPIAQCIAWLILSHHRLPKKLNSDITLDSNSITSWLTQLGVEWNALNHENCESNKIPLNLTFKLGTPIRSKTWQKKAKEIAKRALKLHNFSEYAHLEMAFPLHIARLALMLADHNYSADQPHPHWQDPHYKAIANTDKTTKEPKQHLDEHCIGVAHNAYLLALTIPKLRQSMPAITQHKDFKRRSKNDKFRWQDKAYDCAYNLTEQSQEQGFFGINMASTGKGKTFANARICYALANPQLGCRFSIALGLRTLTLQTGEALQHRLHLDNDDVAVQIGSQEIKALFESQQKIPATHDKNTGSESEQHFAEHYYVRYEGEIENNYLNRWLKNQNKILKLVSSPISVSTIDHLIPASEGTSGGQQIAPMLRLLTSDLVLDEPDDFSLEDLPALGRLVYFAGLLGSRVLLSSATLPPYLVQQLFSSYYTGRKQFNQVTGQRAETDICCAWFDEFSSQAINCDLKQFEEQHKQFIQKRVENLKKENLNLHLGNWLMVNHISKKDLYPALAQTLYQGITQLATQHRTVSTQTRYQGKSVSTGIIRIANINPLVAVAKALFNLPAAENTCIHYCIYHSQHPLATRSAIENQLDALLQRDRQNPQDIFEKELVVERLQQFPEQHHIFVVLATPVAEVGRDHDYDWAIIEPSSMRSIIQLVGRVQRHRQLPPQLDNILILNKNIKAIKGEVICYTDPGFECKETEKREEVKLPNHDLSLSALADYFQPINAIPRIQEVEDQGLIDIEHRALKNYLSYYLRNWWKSNYAHLFAEFQKQTEFRQSRPTRNYIVELLDDDLTLKEWEPASQEWIESSINLTYQEPDNLPLAKRISIWGSPLLEQEIEQLADQFNLSLEETYLRFAQISLPEGNYLWYYHPHLGFYRK